MSIEKPILDYLRSRFSQGRIILFTGAGFSSGAQNKLKEEIPGAQKLKERIWKIAFPGDAFEPESDLQNVFEVALALKKGELKEALTKALTVDSGTIPEYYRRIYSAPWSRIYTLNLDNLSSVAHSQFSLPRQIKEVSATGTDVVSILHDSNVRVLQEVHINGTLADVPDRVTFSARQYSARLAQSDATYTRLTADLVSNSFVFIGSSLNEPSLWQHIEIRKAGVARGLRELRPKSFLVIPVLDKARRRVLEEYNIEWIPMNAQEFSESVLKEVEDAFVPGQQYLSRQSAVFQGAEQVIPVVSELAIRPQEGSDFLQGQEPIWADIQSGRAVNRSCDEQLWSDVSKRVNGSRQKEIFVVTGTSGSGKSAALMRLALRISSEFGISVGWIGKDVEIGVPGIERQMAIDGAPEILAIDDADMYGTQLAVLIARLLGLPKRPIILVAIRSGKIDSVLNPGSLDGVVVNEVVMPHLEDGDIDLLLDVLDRENRLGVLKGRPRPEQQKVFRLKAGRQLLVAMIEATSNRRFEEKIQDELDGLSAESKLAYATIAVATALRFSLLKAEVLVATDQSNNAMLNAIDGLLRRKLLVAGDKPNSVRARHRRIAEVVLEYLRINGNLKNIMAGLAFLAATKVDRTMGRTELPWRMLRTMINHDFLARTLGVDDARAIYVVVEGLLSWDHHYWLQRGSLEVEVGILDEAENFLGQARSLGPDDPFVENAWAYLLYKKANENPAAMRSDELVREAQGILEGLIASRGKKDPYPFHVLGSQGLSWVRRGVRLKADKVEMLRYLDKRMKAGVELYPRNENLSALQKDIYKELLLTASS